MTSTMARLRTSADGTLRRFTAGWDESYRNVQFVLFTAGSVLMPLGILLIMIGWYGAAHTKYQYDQMPYLVSGGVLGLGLTCAGGFLYFGAWLSKMASEQRESAHRFSDTMLLLADLVSRSGAPAEPVDAAAAAPVLTSTGNTVHRRDCPLIAERDDLREVSVEVTGLRPCAACQPTLPSA